jgi:8-oxo-dGTP pyrophosphatase MutT (NUDIX family)
MKTLSKVGVFVVRKRAGSSAELLLFKHIDHLNVPLQIPGGGIEPREEPYAAALRELHEEAGIRFLPLIRALGISESKSVVHPDLMLRRHCYLFDGAGLPDSWIHEVDGGGEDKGLRFAYRWYGIASDFHLPGDLDYFLNREALPELFETALQ